MKIKNTLAACSMFVLVLFNYNTVQSQITILNANLSPYNITPASLCQVNMMNYDQEMDVVLEVRLSNSGNEPLITIRSNPFRLKKGMNVAGGMNISISSMVYGNSNQAGYIKTSRLLPSGKFTYCCSIRPVNSPEPGDDYCEDVEGSLTSFLLLVNPFDKDTVETIHPLLIWSHSEAFNMLAAGEHFRMVVTEITSDQNAESAITVNTPVYMKNYLAHHQVQYPFDAKQLEEGKHYAWQIQKMSNGIIINKSEAWEFIITSPEIIKENKYAVLKKSLDAGFYTVENNKLYFKFEEEYGEQQLKFAIYNSKREIIRPDMNNEDEKGGNEVITLKSTSYNRFEINLNESNISTGFYMLEITNEKKEIFKLKFYVQ